MKASIIIPAFNEEIYIKQCVTSLLHNDYINKEIIVVNDGSTDNTVNVLSGYDSIKVITIEKCGRLHAIKAGIKNASGDIILKIDADSIAPHNWVTKMVEHFYESKVIIVGGTIKNRYFNGPLFIGLKCLDEIYNDILRRRLSVCKLMGANWAIRSYLVQDEKQFENKINDESLLFSIIKFQKGNVIFDKEIYVTINSPKNFLELWQRKYQWGKRAVMDKRYKNIKFWIRPLYFILLILSFCFISTTPGRLLLFVVTLPLIGLIFLSLLLNPISFLITPIVFLVSEFGFVYGTLTGFIRRSFDSKSWK